MSFNFKPENPHTLSIKYVTVCFSWEGKVAVQAEVGQSTVLPTGLSEGKSAAPLAWIAYQGGGIARKYMSLKECEFVFLFFSLLNVFLVGKEQKIPKFPGLSFPCH